MNTIKITQVKPDAEYNSIFTFSEALKNNYEPLRKYVAVELAAGKEEFDGTNHTWKMNLSNSKIDMLVAMLKNFFTDFDEAHGMTDEIIPGEPIQSLKK